METQVDSPWDDFEIDYEHVICPDGTLRKVEHLARDPYEFSREQGLRFVSLMLKGQRIQGWRDKDGKFLPHLYSKGFLFLVERDVLGTKWKQAATDPIRLENRVRASRRAEHRCQPSESRLQAMTLEGTEAWTVYKKDKYGNSQPIHGAAKFDEGKLIEFHPWAACSNSDMVGPIRSADDLAKAITSEGLTVGER